MVVLEWQLWNLVIMRIIADTGPKLFPNYVSNYDREFRAEEIAGEISIII